MKEENGGAIRRMEKDGRGGKSKEEKESKVVVSCQSAPGPPT